jgi:uncharacterized protein (DUF1786 family)
MSTTHSHNLSQEIIEQLGIQQSQENPIAQIAPDARVFEYPDIDNVFIMESDLYGNTMPEGSCFLAFYGSHGLIGKHIYLETLRNASINDIRTMVESHSEG